jgi:hypothetical protein
MQFTHTPQMGGSVGLRRGKVSYSLKPRDSGARCEAAPGVAAVSTCRLLSFCGRVLSYSCSYPGLGLG